jgi:hypothetical protein
MALLTQVTVSGAGVPVNHTRATMSASDTLTYVGGSGQHLILYNTTGVPVVLTIIGSTATTIPGYGAPISVAAGKTITVPATQTTSVLLDSISAYLSGVITLTGGVGLVAHITI